MIKFICYLRPRLGQVAVLSIAQKTRWKVKEKEETEKNVLQKRKKTR